MDESTATTQAVSESYISVGDGTPVTIHGVKTTHDVVAAIREANKRCPNL